MSRNNTGNPIDSKAYADFEDNVKNFDQWSISKADTFKDREGDVRLTLRGTERAGAGDTSIAVDAAARAVAAAGQVEQNAVQIGQDAAAIVIAGVDGAVDEAQGYARQAEMAAGAARADGSYVSTAAGLAATSSGDVFLVATANPNEFLMYENASGSAVSRGPFSVAGASEVAVVSSNAQRARALVVGRVTEISYNSMGVPTVSITEPGYVYKEANGGVPLAVIAPLPNPITLSPNNGLVVDIVNGPFDGQGRAIPQVVVIASGAQTGWQSASKFVILAAGGAAGSPLSGLYSTSFAEAERAMIPGKYARVEISGSYLISSFRASDGLIRVKLNEGCVLSESGQGVVKRIAPTESANISPGVGYVADLDAGPFDEQGRVIPQIATISSATRWQTGNRYVLFGSAPLGSSVRRPKSDLFGAYTRVESGAFDGAVAWQRSAGDQPASWDSASRTLTWPDTFLLVDGFSSRVGLLAGSVVFPSGGFLVALLDMAVVDTLTSGADLPPESVVIKSYGSSFTGENWNGEDGRYIPLFVVGFNYTYPVRFTPVVGSTTFPAAGGGGASTRTDALLVKCSGTGEVQVFQPGGDPSTGGAVEVVYTHAVDTERGADVWRLNGIYAATREGVATTRGIAICNAGEIEMAISIQGKSDFIGGLAHGDEATEWVKMLVNGAEASLASAATIEAETVEFLQKSKLFEPDTAVPQSNHIATAWKRVKITAGDVEISNRVEWLQSFNLSRTYLSMMPMVRDDAGGAKVSDRGYRAPYWEVEDISAPDHAEVETKAQFIKLSGPSGYGCEMEILDGWDKPNRRAFISNGAPYNKLYFDFTGSGYVTEAGEVMEAKSRFRVWNSN